MLTFEQAKGLKKGDVVYESGIKCFVVSVALDEKTQTAEVIYTDGGAGGDEFTGRTGNPKFGLTRQGT